MQQYLRKIYSYTIKIFYKYKYRIKNNNPLVLYSKIFLLPRILRIIPIPVEKESYREVHILSCKKDFIAMLWALYSFYFHSDKKFPLIVHDDGSLCHRHEKMLKSIFPGSRLIFRSESDYEMKNFLNNFQNCLKLRESCVYSIKIFDFFYYCKSDSMIIMDADVLFFGKINDVFLSNELKFNFLLEDLWSNYEISTAEIKKALNIVVPEKINSGLGLIWKKSFNIPFIEDILSNRVFSSIKISGEQIIFAILSARYGVRFLKKEYGIILRRGINGLVAKHYTRLVRNLLYTEGIPFLLRIFSKKRFK